MAEADYRWQLEPAGFPERVSAFVSVRDGERFRRDLTADDFSFGIDEYVGVQGGWIRNGATLRAGTAGADVLVVIDRSRTYTGEFREAVKTISYLLERLDPARDRVGLATTPTDRLEADVELLQALTNDARQLQKALDDLEPLERRNKSTARICHALDDAVDLFPEERTKRYRSVVYVSGGVDRGEGRGDCVEASYAGGKIPFYMLTLDVDRAFRDTSNAHRLESRLEELAEKTGGRSIFRRDDDDDRRFITALWDRARSLYHFEVEFPCFRPAPAREHVATLKVENRDAEVIRFTAPSTLAPTPFIESFEPTKVTRDRVDDGNVSLQIKGSGFCGAVTSVRAFIDEQQLSVKSVTPFELVATLNSGVERGNVKIINRFGKAGTSGLKLDVVEPEPGSEASSALSVFVLIFVAIVLASIAFLALRKRTTTLKADDVAASIDEQKSGRADTSKQTGVGTIAAAETVKMKPIRRAWVRRGEGKLTILEEGENTIGRDEGCAIRLDIEGVSRVHARLELVSVHGIIWLEDLNSTNGTYWGPAGSKGGDLEAISERKRLEKGDILSIGGETMTVHFEN